MITIPTTKKEITALIKTLGVPRGATHFRLSIEGHNPIVDAIKNLDVAAGCSGEIEFGKMTGRGRNRSFELITPAKKRSRSQPTPEPVEPTEQAPAKGPRKGIRLDNLPAPWANDPVARQDFQRFAWFSDQWVAASETDPELYGDARYSLQTAAYDPIWGIRFSHHKERPTEWVSSTRERKLDWPKLWQEIRGTDPAYQPIPPH